MIAEPAASFAAENALPREAWASFARRYWEREPFLFRGALPQLPASPDSILAVMAEMGEHARAGTIESLIQCFREDGFMLSGPAAGRHLPAPQDRSAGAYADRLTRRLGRFALLLNDVLAYDAGLWLRIRQFLRGLQREVPGLFCRSGLFFGNYESTPFGIHRDDVGALMIVLEGRKRIHAWPGAYFEERPEGWNSLDYHRYLPDAVTLEGGPGDVLYWPSGYWHVGASDGDLTISLNLGVQQEDPKAEAAEELLARLEEAVATECDSPLARLRAEMERLERSGDWEEALRRRRLERESAGGFETVPPPLPLAALADETVINGSLDFPVLWMPAPNREIRCAAHGHSFTIPADPRIIRLLERLNDGAPARVAELIRDYSGETRADGIRFVAAPEGIRTLLSRLQAIRAISA
jgi:hypothetical protein